MESAKMRTTLLEETHCKVEIIYLSGGSGRDKALFAQCVNEFFDVIDNQRYILVKKKGHKGLNGLCQIVFRKRRRMRNVLQNASLYRKL